MNLTSLTTLLKLIQQEHLFSEINKLSLAEQGELLQQLKSIDVDTLRQQQKLLTTDSLPSNDPILPLRNVRQADPHDAEEGRRLLSSGKVGCLMVAGGQGTRLGFSGPKGCFPITPVRHHTLFQYFAERVHAASVQVGRALPLAIMASPLNQEESYTHFSSHHFFGCVEEQLAFFSQGMLPFLDKKGRLFFESPGKIACGPDGNGSAIQAFFSSGIAEQWERAGIELVTFILVDNPLADPFDPLLIGAHAKAKCDVTLKCIERTTTSEKVGVVVEQKEKPTILEYSEMPPEEWLAFDEKGSLRHKVANISLFCFSLPFLKRVASRTLPLHKAFKAATEKMHAWKFERFIFDLLPFASSCQTLLFERGSCFAPLKNATGVDSIKTTQEALSQFDRATLATITGLLTPLTCLEIDPAFYYPTPSLLAKWKRKQVPSSPYVES